MTKEYVLNTTNMGLDDQDETCYLAPDDPVWELKKHPLLSQRTPVLQSAEEYVEKIQNDENR